MTTFVVVIVIGCQTCKYHNWTTLSKWEHWLSSWELLTTMSFYVFFGQISILPLWTHNYFRNCKFVDNCCKWYSFKVITTLRPTITAFTSISKLC